MPLKRKIIREAARSYVLLPIITETLQRNGPQNMSSMQTVEHCMISTMKWLEILICVM
jgi:hypothetical protein